MSNDIRLARLHASLHESPYSGKINSLCLRKDDGIREHPDSIELDIQKGAIGDRWIWRTWKQLENGDSDPRVQIAVCNSRIINLIQNEKNNPYHPGDNIMVDHDLSAPDFAVGKRFRVGEVTLEVTDVYNDACAKFAGEFGKDILKWINIPKFRALNLRGIYCRIIEGGNIQIGDRLNLD
jgi:hypothetical protein